MERTFGEGEAGRDEHIKLLSKVSRRPQKTRVFFSPPKVLEVFHKYIRRAECTQRSEHSGLHVYPTTWHRAMKIVKKPLEMSQKSAWKLEPESYVIIPSQRKHRNYHAALSIKSIGCLANQDLISNIGWKRRWLRTVQQTPRYAGGREFHPSPYNDLFPSL